MIGKLPGIETMEERDATILGLEKTALFYLEQGWINRYNSTKGLIDAMKELRLE